MTYIIGYDIPIDAEMTFTKQKPISIFRSLEHNGYVILTLGEEVVYVKVVDLLGVVVEHANSIIKEAEKNK